MRPAFGPCSRTSVESLNKEADGLLPKCVLVIDDHPVVRAGIRAALSQRSDWEVCGEAGDGETALRLAIEKKPDVAIIDYSLPILNGLETTRRLRQLRSGIAVLIYTMHDNAEFMRDALEAGARGYLHKSADDSEIVVAVDALLNDKPYFPRNTAAFLPNDRTDQGNALTALPLTTRERDVVRLVAEGETNKKIATRWGISVKTVDTHRTSAMRKLNLRTAVDLARYAIRNKLIEP